MFEGYLELGGNEIINSARTVGYLNSGECPSNWIVCAPCDGIQDALGHDDYNATNITQAPWYDEQEEASHRFYGVHALSVDGLSDSTRTATISEGITDGGVVGQVRHAVRQTRYRALLSAVGEDALESGLAWLKAALDPDFCGTHGSSCGASDSCFFTACPPTRDTIVTKVVEWDPDPVVNLVTNPSFERAASASTAGQAFSKPTGAAGQLRIVDTGMAVEFWIACSDPATNIASLAWSGFVNGAAVNGNVNLPAGFIQRMVASYPVTASQTVQFNIPATGTSGLGGPTSHSALITRNPILFTNLATNPSFESPGAVQVLATNLLTNPSLEAFGGVPIELRRNLIANNPSGLNGLGSWVSRSPAVLTAGATGVVVDMPSQHPANADVMRNDDAQANTPGTWWSSSVDIEVPAGYPAVVVAMTLEEQDCCATQGSTVTVYAGQKVRISISAVTTTGQPLRSVVRTGSTQPMAAGSRFIVSRLILEKAPVGGPYFDGGTTGDGEYSYLWSGTPNASASIQNVTPPASILPGRGAVGWSSLRWSSNRSRSVVLRQVEPNQTDSNVALGGAVGSGMNFGVQAGKTYTIRGKIRLTAPQVFNGTGRARGVTVFFNGGATEWSTPSVPNVPGVHDFSGTFTVPAGTTDVAFRLYSGSGTYGEEIWFDSLMLVEGTYTGPYFDGTANQPERRNIYTHPRLVNDQGGWSSWGDWGMQIGPTGNTAHLFSPSTGAGAAGIQLTDVALHPRVGPGEPLTLSIEVTLGSTQDGPKQLVLALSPSDSAGNLLPPYTILGTEVTFQPGETKRISVTMPAAPAGTYRVGASIRTGASGALGFGWTSPVYTFRNVLMERSATPGAYFDGATPPPGRLSAWEGTADASPSYSYDPSFTYAWTGTPDASTSTKSGMGVAGVPVAVGADVSQVGDTPAHGAKALRFTVTATTDVVLGLTSALPTQGSVYTLMGKVRPRTRDQALVPQIRATHGTTFIAPKDVWTEFRVSVVAGGGPASDTGFFLQSGTGHQVGDLIDVDAVMLVAGYYTGPYFDGSTADSAFAYDWTGAANASTSVVSAPDVADVTAPVPGTMVRWQDTESPASGSKIVRYQTTAVGDLYFPIAAYGHTTGDTFTIYGRVRPKTRTTTFAVAVRGTKSITFVAPMGVWTEFQAEVIAGSGAADTSGLFALGGATQPGDVIDIDTVLETLGTYAENYFDGDTADQPEDADATLPIGTRLERYSWTGTAHASTSTRETGQVLSAPDPVGYEAALDTLHRTMHDVTCISGPLIEQKFHRGSMWGYIVEFTLAAGTPWLFGKTRSIVIPPGFPVVIQDVPFNLVPYPSAELASGTVVAAKNFSTNPSVETNVTGWASVQDGTKILAAQLGISRSNELAAAGGGFSAKVLFTANTTNSAGWFGAGQTVALPGITPTTRYSINLWAVASVQSGTAVLGNIDYVVYWQDAAGTTLRVDPLGSLAASGGAISKRSILPPAGTTKAFVHARINVTSWSSGALIRLYADALAVTVP